MSSQQHVEFHAERAGSAFRGEVVDTSTFATIAKTHLTYSDAAVAKIAARRMWEARAARIANAMTGQVVA